MNEAVEVYLAAVRATEGGEAMTAGSVIAWAIVISVLLLLACMSLVSWAIIFQKIVRLRAASSQSSKFLDLFWASKRLDSVYEKVPAFRGSPIAEVFRAGYQELAKINAGATDGRRADATDNLTRTLRRASAAEATGLERNVTFLATTGSTAPFIGLFGTVVGILAAFNKLGGGGPATIEVVGPDIGFALISTAVGLAAAIPAVIAYNAFANNIRVLTTEMDNFSADFLNLVKRHIP